MVVAGARHSAGPLARATCRWWLRHGTSGMVTGGQLSQQLSARAQLRVPPAQPQAARHFRGVAVGKGWATADHVERRLGSTTNNKVDFAGRSYFHQGEALRRDEPPLSPQEIEEEFEATKEDIAGSATWSGKFGFDEMTLLSEDKPPNYHIIDVREPAELQSEGGTVPQALNVPITTHPNAFLLPAEEFAHRFGFEKPDPAKAVLVTFCRAGVRAVSAASLAHDAGYRKVAVYPGSWLDWRARDGKREPYEPRGDVWGVEE